MTKELMTLINNAEFNVTLDDGCPNYAPNPEDIAPAVTKIVHTPPVPEGIGLVRWNIDE